MNKKPIILFDIDYTLFDMEKFRIKMLGEIVKKIKHEAFNNLDNALNNAYFFYRKESGTFDPKSFISYLIKKLKVKVEPEILEKAITKKSIFLGHLYEETKEVLERLSKNKLLKIGIFSGGEINFQKNKIREIEEYLHKEHMHIFTFKNKQLSSIVEKYKRHRLYLIDDFLEILHDAKKSNKNIFTVWVKRGRFAAGHKGISGFQPDATVTSLREVISIIKKINNPS